MAAEIRQFTALIPAGTTAAAPVRRDMSFPPREVLSVEIRVPPGPSGLVGFALQNSGVTIIPYGSDPFIVTAADEMNWPLQGYVNSGSWQLLGYNTGAFPHRIYVRFLLGLVQPAPESGPSPALAVAAQVSGGGPSTADLAALLDTGGAP